MEVISIKNYLEENQLNYCIDKTNLTDDYTRNKIRNHILPYVDENIVKGSVSHIYDTANFLRQQEEYLEEETRKVFFEVAKKNADGFGYEIDRKKFSKLHIFMKKKVLYKVIEESVPTRKNVPAHTKGFLSTWVYNLVASEKQRILKSGNTTPVRIEVLLLR